MFICSPRNVEKDLYQTCFAGRLENAPNWTHMELIANNHESHSQSWNSVHESETEQKKSQVKEIIFVNLKIMSTDALGILCLTTNFLHFAIGFFFVSSYFFSGYGPK